ncbi:MAG TPA: PAS domain-containing protein, partial [Pirellulales bacterium]
MASAEQLKGCAAAIGATAFVAIALLVIEDRVAALQTFLLPFIVPVVAASWWGGLRCGLLATALNFGVVVTFFSGPDQGLNLAHGVDQARLTLFVAIAAIISVASDRLHRFRKQAAVTEAVAAERERALQHEIGERRKAERHLRLVLEGLPQLVWTCQADGSADYHSPQWVSYTGLSAEECRGDGWTKAIHPDDLPGLMNRWLQATTADVVFESEYRLRSHAGEYRWFKSRAVLL